MDVAITGSSGLVGSALGDALHRRGDRVIPVRRGDGIGVRWDPEAGRIDGRDFEGVDAVVHLAAENLGEARWNDEEKRRIRDSRERGTELLATTLAGVSDPPRVLVSASAIGIYGDRGDERLTESSPPGPEDDFLVDVVRRWEAATAPAEAAGIRTVHLRSGIVLSRNGGALARMILPFKLGLGGRIAGGRQYMSWIGLEDEVGAILHAVETSAISGPVNATAPNPVTNSEFTSTLGAVLHRPTILPTPLLPVKLRYGGELVDHLLVQGQRVLPAVLERTGYEFVHPDLRAALTAALG
jgi:uncharacterized protein (TIGR01777 family)